jgi:hypothetical protein
MRLLLPGGNTSEPFAPCKLLTAQSTGDQYTIELEKWPTGPESPAFVTAAAAAAVRVVRLCRLFLLALGMQAASEASLLLRPA